MTDTTADSTAFGLELYTAQCEYDPVPSDSWLFKSFVHGDEGSLRRGNIQQEAYHPLKDLNADDLIIDSDWEQELYAQAGTGSILESASREEGVTKPQTAGVAAVSIRLHDGSYRFGVGLAWIVCKLAVALDGITTLLGQLCELGQTRQPVTTMLLDVRTHAQ